MGLGCPTILSAGALRSTGATTCELTRSSLGGAKGDPCAGDSAVVVEVPGCTTARDATLGLGSFIFGSRLPSAPALPTGSDWRWAHSSTCGGWCYMVQRTQDRAEADTSWCDSSSERLVLTATCR
jgi:hypothetical protein